MSSGNGVRRLVRVALPPYLAFGASLGLLQVAIPSMLQAEGIAASRVSLLALLMLPLCLSALWAPLTDRYDPFGWGRRKSWFVGAEAVMVGALVAMAIMGSAAIVPVMVAMAIMMVAATTMDVVLDGAIAERATPQTAALRGNLKVAGMLVGTIAGSTGVMALVQSIGWTPTLLGLAALTACAGLPFALEARRDSEERPRSLPSPRAFARLPGIGIRLLLLVCLGLALGIGMTVPRLVMIDQGYPLGLVGIVFGMVGPIAGALGALGGLAITQRFGPSCSFATGSVLFAVAVAATSALLSGGGAGKPEYATAIAVAVAAFAYAIVYGGLSGFAMGWVGADQAATDYAAIQNAWILSIILGTAASGELQAIVGAVVLGFCGVVALLATAGLVMRERIGRVAVARQGI